MGQNKSADKHHPSEEVKDPPTASELTERAKFVAAQKAKEDLLELRGLITRKLTESLAKSCETTGVLCPFGIRLTKEIREIITAELMALGYKTIKFGIFRGNNVTVNQFTIIISTKQHKPKPVVHSHPLNLTGLPTVVQPSDADLPEFEYHALVDKSEDAGEPSEAAGEPGENPVIAGIPSAEVEGVAQSELSILDQSLVRSGLVTVADPSRAHPREVEGATDPATLHEALVRNGLAV